MCVGVGFRHCEVPQLNAAEKRVCMAPFSPIHCKLLSFQLSINQPRTANKYQREIAEYRRYEYQLLVLTFSALLQVHSSQSLSIRSLFCCKLPKGESSRALIRFPVRAAGYAGFLAKASHFTGSYSLESPDIAGLCVL